MHRARARKRGAVGLAGRSRIAGAIAVAAAVAMLAAACSSGSSSDGKGGSGDTPGTNDAAPITLKIGLFGTFGFKEAGLYEKYHELHPNITIQEDDVEQSAQYWQQLQTKLAGGSGVDDIQGIEIGFVADVVANHADQFVDFNTLPDAAAVKDTFYPWKWSMITTSDGKTLGLGTDAGPEAMCYRSDLFKAAGLPTDRDELSQKWSTWDGYLQLGEQYMKSPTRPEGTAFVDAPGSVFSAAVYQGKTAYADSSGKVVVNSSDGVQHAWAYASQAAKDGLTSGLTEWTDPWNQGFAKAQFATIPCPAWMLGYITGQAKDSGKGKWDVASLPGGAANWGGSWLGVPKASKHQKEAMEFVKWLTAPEQQLTMWTDGQHWPSSSKAAEDPAVANATSDYFSNAPIGKIYGDIASKLTMPPISPVDTQIQNAASNDLLTIATNHVSPDDAWKAFQNDLKQITG